MPESRAPHSVEELKLRRTDLRDRLVEMAREDGDTTAELTTPRRDTTTEGRDEA